MKVCIVCTCNYVYWMYSYNKILLHAYSLSSMFTINLHVYLLFNFLSLISHRMVLHIGSTLLRTVVNASARHSSGSWNCLFKAPGLSFHSVTRNLNQHIVSDFNVKCSKPGQRLGIFTKCVRFHSTKKPDSGWVDRLRYSAAVIVVMTGATVLSVPLYRVFCQVRSIICNLIIYCNTWSKCVQ
jgi:hypothetical protein